MTRAATVAMVMYPRFTQLDLTGPLEVFARTPGATVQTLAPGTDPVVSDSGLRLLPDAALEPGATVDVLCVPGGPGVNDMLINEPFLEALHDLGSRARFVTSVCSGSLLLGAAGLLVGYRATSHWMSVDLLPLFGAIPVRERVVVDRNRISGGGVTAGIDFGLSVAAMLAGDAAAQQVQLMLEYNPAPPFDAGSPDRAAPDVVEAVRRQGATYLDARYELARQAARRLERRGASPG